MVRRCYSPTGRKQVLRKAALETNIIMRNNKTNKHEQKNLVCQRSKHSQ